MGFQRGTSSAYATPAMGGASGGGNEKLTSYEQTREERIKQNMERMKQLGLHDLSLKLKAVSKKPTPTARRSPQHSAALPPPGPRRRSSRLQKSSKVDYTEVALKKKDNSGEDERDLLSWDGSRPEFYTEEHMKLLGTTDKSWTLFVDGYAEDGKRIYDPVDGKTCHQCRQKTLGHRTNCCKCNKVQGQFCGDCLYMRYGEHVLEANQNPDWICPACRGICNCSLCRQAKGWAPTGMLYKKVTSLGFKSVAHYIIQTRQKNSNADASPGSKVPTSAKKSLPFADTDQNSHPVDADYASYLTETTQKADATDGDTVDPGSSGVINDEPESDDCSNAPLQVQKLVINDVALPPSSPADATTKVPGNSTSAAATKPSRKRALVPELPNSIAARLRERRAAARARRGDL